MRFVLASFALFAAACSSGVPGNTLAADLTTEDIASLCEEFAADYPEETYTCEFDGVTFDVTIGFSADDCDLEVPSSTCTATVDDYRACADALTDVTQEEVCSGEETEMPSVCEPVFAAGCAG